jgi:hypothetical protein
VPWFWKLEIKSLRKLEAGSWKLEVGNWKVEGGISLVLSVSFICLASISLKGGKNTYSRQRIDGYTVLHAFYSGFCLTLKGAVL